MNLNIFHFSVEGLRVVVLGDSVYWVGGRGGAQRSSYGVGEQGGIFLESQSR